MRRNFDSYIPLGIEVTNHMRMEEKHICPQKGENHLYKIGMFAQMNHVTVRALHFYEEHKLLLPAWIDAENGYRYYTMDQMAVLHQIMALKQAGFTIEDIKRLQETSDTSAYLRRKKTELLNKIAELTRQISVLDGYMAGRGSTIERPVLIKTIPAAIVASTQARIESYDVLFELMPRLGAEMERLGCRCALPEYCFTGYLESGYQEKHILVEVCEAVTEKKEDTDLVKFQELPQMQAACIYHKGSYNEFPESYAAVLQYIEENGYEICGNIRESYIDGVWNKDSEDEWLTEIQIPVKTSKA